MLGNSIYRSLFGRIHVGWCPLAAAAGLALASVAPTQAAADEIVVVIRQVRALDKIDQASPADFMVRVTIDGAQQTSPVIKDQDVIRPNWTLRRQVEPGAHELKVELFDKDVIATDAIDINRLADKRDLDFSVDTRSCVITGFSTPYRCGSLITRAGNERKRAAIAFTVTATR